MPGPRKKDFLSVIFVYRFCHFRVQILSCTDFVIFVYRYCLIHDSVPGPKKKIFCTDFDKICPQVYISKRRTLIQEKRFFICHFRVQILSFSCTDIVVYRFCHFRVQILSYT